VAPTLEKKSFKGMHHLQKTENPHGGNVLGKKQNPLDGRKTLKTWSEIRSNYGIDLYIFWFVLLHFRT